MTGRRQARPQPTNDRPDRVEEHDAAALIEGDVGRPQIAVEIVDGEDSHLDRRGGLRKALRSRAERDQKQRGRKGRRERISHEVTLEVTGHFLVIARSEATKQTDHSNSLQNQAPLTYLKQKAF